MKKNELKASILLTLAAVIWGFAFVAQRVGAQYTGSFYLQRNSICFRLLFSTSAHADSEKKAKQEQRPRHMDRKFCW